MKHFFRYFFIFILREIFTQKKFIKLTIHWKFDIFFILSRPIITFYFCLIYTNWVKLNVNKSCPLKQSEKWEVLKANFNRLFLPKPFFFSPEYMYSAVDIWGVKGLSWRGEKYSNSLSHSRFKLHFFIVH